MTKYKQTQAQLYANKKNDLLMTNYLHNFTNNSQTVPNFKPKLSMSYSPQADYTASLLQDTA